MPEKVLKFIFLPLVLVLIISVTYSPVLNHGFIENWDDNYGVFDNPDVQGFSIDRVKNWFTKGYLGMFQPVTMSTYAINFEIAQFEPAGYHLFNVIIFVLIAFLIWRLLYTLTNNFWAAAIVVLFYAVHPFAVESVAWVTGRIALLMVLFMLIALNYYASGGRNFLILFSLYLLATLSKINGILLPIYLFVIDFTQQNKPFSKSNLIPKVGLILLISPVLLFSLTLRAPDNSMSLIELIPLIPAKYLWYLNHLIPVYEYSPVYEPPGYLDWRNIIGLLFILFTYWTYKQSSEKNKKLILMGSLIFICCLVPHMLPFSIGAQVGDRYGFVSYMGIAIILAAFVNQFASNRRSYFVLLTILAVISIINIFITNSYTRKWQNADTLWNHAVEVVPESSIAHTKLGTFYLSNGNKRARAALTRSVSLDPGYSDAYYNLGSLSFYEGKFDEAIEYFTKVYELENQDIVLIDRASSYYAMKDYKNAIKDLDQYLKKRPEAKAFFIRGQSKLAIGLDGCPDLKLALDMGIDRALSFYAKNCITKIEND